ncbi:MAG: choline dehydrogenase [Arenicella sp.]|jgi:choline dehydrogenase|nr:choline dehydrogenase [Arenicella sp.]
MIKPKMTDLNADYVIVGAGSAGCILANRLSEDPNNKVILLEAGGSDKSIFIKMPTALSYPMNTKKYNWDFHSEPEPHLDQRSLHCPRGKVLGGSSSINGMVFVRGHALDFDEWEQHGATGWGYRNCLPYFKKLEKWYKGGDDYRGNDGPVEVNNGNDMRNPLYRAFVDAGKQAGYPYTQDYNGAQQEGFGAMHMNVGSGVRESTARAYLDPVRRRPNLRIIKHASAEQVMFEGKRATGVHFTKHGKTYIAKGSKEVILAAGSIGSPTLLQRSGIGPAAHLQALGIKVLKDLPGVGQNLQDHLEVYFQFHCKKPISLNGSLDLISMGMIGARWFFLRSGLGSTNHFESCAFIRSKEGQKWPDIQYHFLPAAMRYDGNSAVKGHGYQVHVGPNKPHSRGSVMLQNPNSNVPQIRFNYLQSKADVEDWRHVIRLTREIMGQAAFDDYRGGEIQPGIKVRSDDDIDSWVRQNVESAYHPSCTAKMGADDDPMAVLDANCLVRGVTNLRVVDSSIFPTIPNGNLNAPTMMVAEKAADIILGKTPLAATDVPVWVEPNWETTQRAQRPQRSLKDIEAKVLRKPI